MSHTTYRPAVLVIATLAAAVAGIGSAAAMQRQSPSSSAALIARVAPAAPETPAPSTQRTALHHPHPATRPPRQTHHPRQTVVRRSPHVSPHATHTAVTRHHHRRAAARVSGPTTWNALNAALARIPAAVVGARWVVSNRYGTWGTTDWYNDVIYIAPNVPTSRLFDVIAHEWGHELSVRDYGGDVDAAVAAMNATFGGSGLTGAERAADCMALLQGATWTHYTSCHDSSWRHAAARLLAGRQL